MLSLTVYQKFQAPLEKISGYATATHTYSYIQTYGRSTESGGGNAINNQTIWTSDSAVSHWATKNTQHQATINVMILDSSENCGKNCIIIHKTSFTFVRKQTPPTNTDHAHQGRGYTTVSNITGCALRGPVFVLTARRLTATGRVNENNPL